MVREINLSRGNSPYIGRLAKGCQECMKGAKLVLFITGKCSKSCFYCPISEERRDQDVIFANEVEVNDISQILAEAQLIDATGMGITGGEPLLELERTCQFIQAFKQEFGSEFHVHLYTGLEPVPIEAVEKLVEVGLDELRLHRFRVGHDYPRLREVTKGHAQLGVEIPMIPGMLSQLKKMFRQLDKIGIDFVNINELECTSLNAEELHQRGLKLDPDTIASVQGSEEEAITLLEWAVTKTRLNVHYCPLSLKDGTQLRNRFKRRAKNVAKPFEEITEEGLLLKGIIIPPTKISLSVASKILLNEFLIPQDQIWINKPRRQIETSAKIVQRIAKQLKAQRFQVGIAEEYPITSRFQVSYLPL
jgi:pyruvate formate-lyase activating enzyme-like uncharacterized protein